MAKHSVTLTGSGEGSVNSTPLRGNYLYCYDQSGLVEVVLYRGNERLETHTVERFVTLNYKDYDHVEFINLTKSDNDITFFYGPGEYQASQDRASVNLDLTDLSGALPVQGAVDVSANAVLPVELSGENSVNVVADNELPVVLSGENSVNVTAENPLPVDLDIQQLALEIVKAQVPDRGVDFVRNELAVGSTARIIVGEDNQYEVCVQSLSSNTEPFIVGFSQAALGNSGINGGVELMPGGVLNLKYKGDIWVHNPADNTSAIELRKSVTYIS